MKTIAFVHAPVTGHTVLPVLACQERVMGKGGALGPIVVDGVHAGEAGVDDPRWHEPVGEGLGVAQAG